MTNQAIVSVDEIFTQLSPLDEAVLVSLPYRIGLYVSYADVTGGWEAQEKEQQSLANILRQYSEDFCKTEFTQKVLMETLKRRSDWPGWSQNIDQVPQESAKVVALLAGLFNEKELRGFKEVMADIAISVAMAFHEGRDVEIQTPSASPGLVAGILSRLKSSPKSSHGGFDHVHISVSERAALARVCDAMKYQLQR